MKEENEERSARRPRASCALGRNLLRVAALLLCAAAMPAVSHAAARFGTRCQSDYQNGWRDTLPYMWNRCAGFNDELDDTDIKVFYWNLHGGKPWFSWCDACGGGGVDDVKLFYVGTHGGATNDTNARLVMWEQNTRALSNTDSWRFGNDGFKAAFLAQYACETMTNTDGMLWTRWNGALKGGLQMVLGSHIKFWDSTTTDECGEDFADGLQKGKTVKWAWLDGNSDWWEDQAIAVVASGDTSTDQCHSRKDGITWQNYPDFGRLRDDHVNWWCRSRIDP